MSKRTWPRLKAMKADGRKIVMITAYDYPSATLAEMADVDIMLVGDSLGNVILGYDSTLPVTMEDMLHHTRPVVRGRQNALVVADMPFGSYEVSVEEGVKNALRFIKEAGADGVKLEGGINRIPLIEAMVSASIPVVGHIGLTPQSFAKTGAYMVQGKTATAAQSLVEDAKALEKAGISLLVLECVPMLVAAAIREALAIPVIGIGAGNGCDGQVLVFHDLLGINCSKKPKFVKEYAKVGEIITAAIHQYALEVRAGAFPDAAHSFKMAEGEDISKLY